MNLKACLLKTHMWCFNNGASRGILCWLLEQRCNKQEERKLLYVSFIQKATLGLLSELFSESYTDFCYPCN